MPGIYGFSTSQKNGAESLQKMSKAMKLYPHFVQDSEFESDKLAASRQHLGRVGEKGSPLSSKGIYVWVEGEAYNLNDVCLVLALPEEMSLGKAMINAYQAGQLDSFLNRLDADFCAILYDKNIQTLKLISDRYE